MYPYFNNQPFLDSLASQTALINSLETKNKRLTIALVITTVVAIGCMIKVQHYKQELNKRKGGGFRLY